MSSKRPARLPTGRHRIFADDTSERGQRGQMNELLCPIIFGRPRHRRGHKRVRYAARPAAASRPHRAPLSLMSFMDTSVPVTCTRERRVEHLVRSRRRLRLVNVRMRAHVTAPLKRLIRVSLASHQIASAGDAGRALGTTTTVFGGSDLAFVTTMPAMLDDLIPLRASNSTWAFFICAWALSK